MNIKNHLFKNKRFHQFALRQANRFLIRPYIQWRNVPLIAITGTNGKTTVTRLLNRIYLSSGYRVGMSCTEGVYHNDVLVRKGDYSYGIGVWHAARDRGMDILVAETGRGGIVRHGLGYSKCQVGVVTNVYDDHLGYEGIHTIEQMAEVKSTIPYHTSPDGTVVLNGDQHLTRSMLARTQASKLFFSVDGKQDKFDRCYYLMGDCIYRKEGSLTKEIVNVKSIPITLNGRATYNASNAMAVLAAVEGMQSRLPVTLATVKTVFREFGKKPIDNPTRMNFLRYKNQYVLLCKCKNPESFRRDSEIIGMIQKTYKFNHVIGILTVVGDRREIHYEKISRIVAPLCRYFFIRPPGKEYLRDRSGSEIVRLLSVGIPAKSILSTENLSLDSIFDWTQKITNGSCLYVYFDALLESDLDIPKLINKSLSIPIEVGE